MYRKKACRAFSAVLALILCVLFPAFSCTCFCEEESPQNKTEKVYELTTSNNPDNYAHIVVNHQSLTVTGKYTTDQITEVTMRQCGTVSSTLKKETDGSFTAVINPQDPKGKYDYFQIKLDSGVLLTYRMEYDNGWYFPDNRLSEKNAEVLQNIVSTSPKAWALYVSDDLDEDTVRQTVEDIRSLSDTIVGDETDDYQKARKILRWVAENIYYDRTARDESVTTATICLKNVLRDRRTVCGGYANIFCALVAAQGIEAVNIRGSVITGDKRVTYETLAEGEVNHEWTAVYIGGRWITVDPGWSSLNYYQDGEYNSGQYDEMYFDITDIALSLDHRAYIAEKRCFMRAGEYFDALAAATEETSAPPEDSDEPTSSDAAQSSKTDEDADSTPPPESIDSSSSAESSADTESRESGDIVPSNPQSSAAESAAENSDNNSYVIWIIIILAGICAALISIIAYNIKEKK